MPFPKKRNIGAPQKDEKVPVLIVKAEGRRLLERHTRRLPLHVAEGQFVNHERAQAVEMLSAPTPFIVYCIDEERFFEKSYLVKGCQANQTERGDDAVHEVHMVVFSVGVDSQLADDVARFVIIRTSCFLVDGLRTDGSNAVALLFQNTANSLEPLYQMRCSPAVLVTEEHIVIAFLPEMTDSPILCGSDAHVLQQRNIDDAFAPLEVVGQRDVGVVYQTHLIHLRQKFLERLFQQGGIGVI